LPTTQKSPKVAFLCGGAREIEPAGTTEGCEARPEEISAEIY
jgi:hypothetical protein